MIKNILLLIILSQSSLMAQDSYIIDKLRKYELDSIQTKDLLKYDEFTKNMVQWQVQFLKTFNTGTEEFEEILNTTYTKESNILGRFMYYLNIGDYYYYKYHDKNALSKEYYLKALNLAKDVDNIYFECEALKRILNLNRQSYLRGNITTAPYLIGYKTISYDQLEKAFYYYYDLILSFQYYILDDWKEENSRFLLRFTESSNNHYLNAEIFQLHAIHENMLLQHSNAITYVETAFDELNKIKYNYKSIATNSSKIAISRYHIFNNESDKATKYLEAINPKPNNRIEEANYRYLFYYQSMIDSINIDFLAAYRNITEYNNRNDYYTILNNQNAYTELEAKYQTEKKNLENKQLKQNLSYVIVGTILILMFGGLIFFLVQKNTTKKRKLAEQESLIEQQKVATLLKEQELTSIDAMIAGQEKERTKVANELHDDLGSLMATVKLHFDNVKVDQKDPALMNAQKLLDEAYQKIRGMAHAKNSGVMANQGLLPAVKKMAKTINESNALKITIEDFGLGERMENSLELTIFRIIQELIANIIKHSKANTASIQFTQHEDRLNIIVEDNGKGFDMAATKRSQNGMGLGTIEKRIEHLEGTFTVDSIIGKGTSILIDIPV